MKAFLGRPTTSSTTTDSAQVSDGSSATASSRSEKVTVGYFISRTDTLKAEVLWSLKVTNSHYSYKSCEDIGERKCAYLCCFGLAPHFKQLLSDKIKNEDGFVLLFDESLNHKCKTKQMDIHVRLWDGDHVTTRYYGSQFMGHATATDMVCHFKEATAQLNMRNVLQLSMDGPNVNWKFHDLMNEDMQTDFGKSLINIGSCGLHVVNGAFKDGCGI